MLWETKPGSKHKTIQHHPAPPDGQEPGEELHALPTSSPGCPQAAHTGTGGGLDSFAPSFPYLSHLFSSVLNPSEWVTGLSYWIHFGHKKKKKVSGGRSKNLEKVVADVEYPHHWQNLVPDSFLLSGWFVGGQRASDAPCRPTYTSENAGLWLERKLSFNIFLQLILFLLPSAKIWSDYSWFQTPLKEEPL